MNCSSLPAPPIMPIMPGPRAAGAVAAAGAAAVGAVGAAGALGALGAAGADGALPMLAGAMERDLPPPRRLAWASVGEARAAMVRGMTRVLVREVLFMVCFIGSQSLLPKPNRLSRLVKRLNSETNRPTVAKT